MEIPTSSHQYSRMPLHMAAQYGHVELVKYLMGEGADPLKLCMWGRTAFDYAATEGHVRVLEVLVEKAGGIDAVTRDGGAGAFDGAILRNHEAVVEFLIRHVETHLTAMALAVSRARLPIVRILAKRHPAALHHETMVESAARSGSAELVRWMVSQGVSFNSTDEHATTPLMIACYGQHAEVVAVLAPLTIRDPKNAGALFYAVRKRNLAMVRHLLHAGADTVLPWADSAHQTPLMAAADQGDLPIVELLLESGAAKSLGAQDAGKGWTAVMFAASRGNDSIVQVLVEAAGDQIIHARDHMDRTALMIAAQGGHSQVVKYLLKKGADPYATSPGNGNTTALLLASFGPGGANVVMEILDVDRRGIDHVDAHGYTALHRAALFKKTFVVKELLLAGAAYWRPMPCGALPMNVLGRNSQEQELINWWTHETNRVKWLWKARLLSWKGRLSFSKFSKKRSLEETETVCEVVRHVVCRLDDYIFQEVMGMLHACRPE
jgi:ankyrin repeat protein